MTFRIDRFFSEGNAIVFRVCGWVEIECVNTIKELIEEETAKLALDLSEVTLANRDAATFLAVCELWLQKRWPDLRTHANSVGLCQRFRAAPDRIHATGQWELPRGATRHCGHGGFFHVASHCGAPAFANEAL
jgi:hypothetical protein